MATLTMANLKEARNAGQIMADVAQPYGQGDTPLSATDHAPTKAVIKAIADRAIAAATAIGGESAPVVPPATEAIIKTGTTIPIVDSANGAVSGTHKATVAASKVTNVKLDASIAPVKSGLLTVAATGTGTKVTITVAGGKITAIALSE